MHSPPRHLIQLAQQRALAGFGTLVERMLDAAAQSMAQASRGAGADEQALLGAARGVLGFEGRTLAERLRQQFAPLLERAMQTMHTDLRAEMRKVSIDQLSLLDDAVMDRQVGVERLVQRLRDAEQLSFGRLNVIIAQLHGVSEVRERENPFRPYLLARALYEAVGGMVREEAKARVLFDHLSAAMAAHIHEYYGPVLEAFEQGGVVGRLAARRPELTRAERERLAWQRAAEQALQPGGALAAGRLDDPLQDARLRLLPRLRGVMAAQAAPAAASAFPEIEGVDQVQSLQALVRSLGARAEPHAAVAPASPALVSALRQAQRAGGAEPLRMAGWIAAHGAGREQRQLLELVALLFEFMLGDGLLDPDLRAQLGRLFVPFARLALGDPAVLREAGHPARMLVDRIGTLAASLDAATPGRAVLEAALGGIVDRLLHDFDGDPAVFAQAGRALGAALDDWLCAGDANLAACAAGLREADALSLRRAAVAAQMAPLLDALQLDPRIAAFFQRHWVEVLARSAPDEAGHAALLAELAWSAQQKLDAAEHGALMRLLPGLVKRLRQGLARLDLSEAQTQVALDGLVAVHMEVLANGQGPAAGALSLDALRRHFAPIERRAAAPAGTAPRPRAADIEAALARHGARAVVRTGVAGVDEAALPALLVAGSGVEFVDGGAIVAGRLVAASGTCLFSVAGRAEPLVLARAALLAGLRDDTIRTREYAPLFERAVDALAASMAALGT